MFSLFYILNITLYLCNQLGQPPLCFENFDLVVNCGADEYEDMKLPDPQEPEEPLYKHRYIYLPIAEGKKGQFQFLNILPSILEQIRPFIYEKKKILFHCAQGEI